MLQGFENFIREQQLFGKEQRLLLALSGGADSVCLFHLLMEGGYNFSAAHCNFGLRGAESDGDEAFVKNLCNEAGIQLYTVQFDTVAAQLERNTALQETARQLRYDWFRQLMQIHHFDFLLTAHHRSDQLETILINMLRATGIRGLHGIPVNDNKIVRPLMFTGREAIRQYLTDRHLHFREDSSNAGDDYLRNALRHQVTEPLKNILPDAENRVYEMSRKVLDYEAIADELMQKQWDQITTIDPNGLHISLAGLEGVQHKAAFLYYCMKSFGYSFSQIEAILSSTTPGKKVTSETHTLLRERNSLFLSKNTGEQETAPAIINTFNTTVQFNGVYIEFSLHTGPVDFTDNSRIFLNAEAIVFPLHVRLWKEGDKIKPLGMNGVKNISDILTDKKVNNNTRKQFPVLVTHNDIVLSLLPLVIHDDYKLLPDTTKILSIRLKSVIS